MILFNGVSKKGDATMVTSVQTFYYSRYKLGLYLLFNLGLLALAIIFTWSIFPNYQPIYYFALITSILSILGSLYVFLVRQPLAVITSQYIKIDHNNPLKWSQIKNVELTSFGHFGFSRTILKITPKKLRNYKMSIMQKITSSSKIGAFSIPLYAMTEEQAEAIEKTIHSHIAKRG